MKNSQTILITGATSGLGYALAKLYAAQGIKLILVGRNKEKLLELEQELPTEIITFACDLSQKSEYMALGEELSRQNLIPDILINNAGLGGMGSFDKRSFSEEAHMIEVNITALTYFCNHFAPLMKAKKTPTYILNIASAAAFVPGAYQAVYYATKAYVYSYTLAMHDELKAENSSLFAACFCPGRFESAFHKRIGALFKDKTLSADKAALMAHHMLMKKKPVYIVPFKMYFMTAILAKFLPRRCVSFYVLRKNKQSLSSR